MADEKNNLTDSPDSNQASSGAFDQIRQKLDDLKLRIPNTENIPKEQQSLIPQIHNLLINLSITHNELNIAQSQGNFTKLEDIRSNTIPPLERQLNEITQELFTGARIQANFRSGQIDQNGPMTVYKDPNYDPHTRLVEKNIIRKTYEDPQVKDAANMGPAHYKSAWNKANLKIKTMEWNNFIQKFPEKAAVYRKYYSPIGNAFELHDKLSKKWEAKTGRTREITLEQDPIYRSFIDDPDTGVSARIWKELPDENSINLVEFNSKAEKIRAEINQQFSLRHPEIAVKYKLLAQKQANITREEKEKRKEEENALKDFTKHELEEQEEELQTSEQIENELIQQEAETKIETPQQNIIKKVEVEITPQAAKPRTQQPKPPQSRIGNIDRLNRGVQNVRSTGRKLRRGASLATKALRIGAGTGARAGATTILGLTSETWIPILLIVLVILIIITFIIVFITAILGQSQEKKVKPGAQPSGTPVPTGSISITPPISPPPPGGDISSCDFYRAGSSPQVAKYQSSTLINYFSDAGNTTGLTAVILAAVARVESPDLVNYTDANLNTIGCPENTTSHALGVMQIMPAGGMSVCPDGTSTTCVCKDCILLGAQYAGLSYADADLIPKSAYCDLRTNIFMAAGFIIKKMQYLGYIGSDRGDPIWVTDRRYTDAIATSYYGCLPYPSCSTGPNNYGDDIWNSVSNCKTITPPGNFIFYCQGDPRWQPPAYTCDGVNSYMGSAGCGPTSVAILLASKGGINSSGQPINPIDVDTTFQDPANRWRACDDIGTLSTGFLTSSWLTNLGFSTAPFSVVPQLGTFDVNLARQMIDQGYWILGSSPDFPCTNLASGTSCSHIFAIDNVDPATETIHVQDPNNCQYGAAGAQQGPRQTLAANGAFTWYWAYPIRRL